MRYCNVKRLTIARNTSGFTNAEVRQAVKVAAMGRPLHGLLLDLTKTNYKYEYKGWCRTRNVYSFPMWRHKGIEYLANGHIRVQIAADANTFWFHPKRGQIFHLEGITRWQVLTLLLAHELGHYFQALRDGKSRCLQMECDRRALKVAKRMGLTWSD